MPCARLANEYNTTCSIPSAQEKLPPPAVNKTLIREQILMWQGSVVGQTHPPERHPERYKYKYQSKSQRQIMTNDNEYENFVIDNFTNVICTLLFLVSLGIPSGIEGADEASSK